MEAERRDEKDYVYTGSYNPNTFQQAYATEFQRVPKFNLASMADLLFVLGKIGKDSRITDVRWAAYMLATTFVESSHTVKIQKETVDKKGRRKTHRVKVWRNFAPIEEAGHGRGLKYYLPVKVARLPTGDAQVTEYDGEQWTVSAATGLIRPLHRHQKRGVRADKEASPIYKDDDGDEQHYFGRGYVQLTWFNSYAAAGVALGQGLDLLFEPDLVNDPNTAYDILSTGMYTGGIYANKRKFSQFFQGGHTDYVGARDMVNAGAKHANKVELAEIAKRFETLLMASKMETPRVAAQ
jgi:hypothetical protein